MKKLKVVLGIFAVFILGAVAGGVIGQGVCWHRPHWGEIHPREVVVRKLTRKLHLDDAQKAQVEVIVNDAHNQMREMRRETQPKIDSIMGSAQDKIRAILRPDQKAQFEKLVSRWKAERQRLQHED
jgi:Spy/CpxP family protein refolding chaperone